MENSNLQVCDIENSQCDVTWKSDVPDVISKHLVNIRVGAFFYNTSDTITFFNENYKPNILKESKIICCCSVC